MSNADEIRKYLNLDAAIATAVEREEPVCPYGMCNGRGTIYRRKENCQCATRGFARHMCHGAFTCKCRFRNRADEMFRASVGAHDQNVRLETLAPSDKSQMPIEVQEKCIAALKKDPMGSYAMFGPSGWSKTTYMTALQGYA